jgi:hypothetical protein
MFVGRGFSRDIQIVRAKRVPLAAHFPRALDLLAPNSALGRPPIAPTPPRNLY